MSPRFARLAAAACIALLPGAAQAQGGRAEERTARYFEAARGQTPLLAAFLREMPKGGDLHSHLSGSVYAESFLRWAAEDGLCVSRRELRLLSPPCTPTADTVAAAEVFADVELHGALVDALSMRNWNPAQGSGHARFFGSFRRFRALPRRTGDMLAEAAARAAAGNVSYLELMITPDGFDAAALGDRAGWSGDFERMRDMLLTLGLQRIVDESRRRLDSVEARRDSVLACGTPTADPGCGVAVRWLYQVGRANPPERVFAQILAGVLLTRSDPRVVGFNLVQPEDHPLAMRDYSLHMRMIGHLRGLHPEVPVTLHAGELAPGLVPPEGLRYHVREAVETAGASRIGHGVAVMHEYGAHELLAEMARRGVLVEINLTSNDVILGIRGDDHPLRAYLAAGVPVALSTDDEGVARSEMTMEYLKAASEHRLGYRALKMIARASLHHAFLEGEPLWRDLPSLTPAAECERRAGGMAGRRCGAFLERSPKARLQHDLEGAFARFEARYGWMPLPSRQPTR